MKWVDFSKKYGIGMQFNNGNVCIHFNDNTKILSSGKEENLIKYIHKMLNFNSRE